MTTNTTTAPNDPTPLRPSITLAPGALDNVPLVPLIRFLADHGLGLRGLTIERAE